MLKLCICDDQPGDLERLEGFTAEFFQSRPDLPALVETFRSPFDLLERLEESGTMIAQTARYGAITVDFAHGGVRVSAFCAEPP